MKTRTAGSALIISLLLSASLNAQNYVLEWQSPEDEYFDFLNFSRNFLCFLN